MFFKNMDALQQIRKPIEAEMSQYKQVFDSYLVHTNPLLNRVLNTIGNRRGKMMRPMLTLLIAKLVGGGKVDENAIYTAATFEFFHTASLVHDDIVDESEERRGQESVNNAYGNQIAVLVGDFILANALLCAAKTGKTELIEVVSHAAQDLADGELLQLNNVENEDIAEEVYFRIIRNKTAALFAACTEAGVLSVSSDKSTRKLLREFGEIIGICFQIRDDIFDYYDSPEIGKPTGNDMLEGKLTLPVIYALTHHENPAVMNLAKKVKAGTINKDEIAVLIEYAKQHDGIKYAEKKMEEFAQEAQLFIDECVKPEMKDSYKAYLDYVIQRNK